MFSSENPRGRETNPKELAACWSIAAVLFGLLWLVPLFSAEPAGTVVQVQGAGRAQSSDGVVRPLIAGRGVYVGDTITVPEASYAVIRFAAREVVTVRANTTVHVLRANGV